MKEFTEQEIYEKLREKVFFYVTYQKRTEAEIRHNFLPLFKKYNISKNAYIDLIEELKEKGHIDDKEFVRKKFKGYLGFKLASVKEIEHKILKKGISRDLIDEYIEQNREMLDKYETESAKKVYEKKKAYKIDSTDEEIKEYLRRKGYREEIINHL